SCPLLLNTRMSGVNGLVGENSPPTTELVSSLHRLGRPCPDSSTNTSKRSGLPRNAIPVGKFRPFANTDTVKPSGTTMSCPLPGLNDAVLFVQIGFATVSAAAKPGSIRNRASANTKPMVRAQTDRIGRYASFSIVVPPPGPRAPSAPRAGPWRCAYGNPKMRSLSLLSAPILEREGALQQARRSKRAGVRPTRQEPC